MKFSSTTEVDRYVQHILRMNSTSTPAPSISSSLEAHDRSSKVKSYWPSIARLYSSVNDYESSLKYAREFLQLHPHDYEVNILAGDSLVATRDYQQALVYYERAAESRADPSGAQRLIAQTCLKLASTSASDSCSDVEDVVLHALLWLKKELPWGGDVYTSRSLDIIQSLLQDVLVLRLLKVKAATEWNQDLFTGYLDDLLVREEVLMRPRLHISLLQCFMSAERYLLVWNAIVERSLVLEDDLEWTNYVLSIIPLLMPRLSPVDAEDLLFFSDNSVRLTIASACGLEDMQWAIDNHRNVLDTCSRPDCVAVDRWILIRQEYIARMYYYVALVEMRQLKRPLQVGSSEKQLVRKIFDSLCMALSSSHTSGDIASHVRSKMRVLLAGRTALALLCCYNYPWIYSQDVNPFRKQCLMNTSTEYPTEFRLPLISQLEYKPGLPESIRTDLETALKDSSGNYTQVIMEDPWNLEHVAWLSTHILMNGSARQLTRRLFPSIPEHKNLANETALTCSDIESFLLQICICRHVDCVDSKGATSLGQVLWLSHPEMWTATEKQQKFWTSCLSIYGSPTFARHSRFTERKMEKSQFSQCLADVRGDSLNYGLRDLYMVCGTVFDEMLKVYQVDRSIEAMHYFKLYTTINERGNRDVTESHLFGATREWTGLLIGVDTNVKKRVKSILSVPNSRYQQFSASMENLNLNGTDPNGIDQEEEELEQENDLFSANATMTADNSLMVDMSMVEERPVHRKEHRSARQFAKLKELKAKSADISRVLPAEEEPTSFDLLLQADIAEHEREEEQKQLADESFLHNESIGNFSNTSNFGTVFEKLREVSLSSASRPTGGISSGNKKSNLPVSSKRFNRQFDRLDALKAMK